MLYRYAFFFLVLCSRSFGDVYNFNVTRLLTLKPVTIYQEVNNKLVSKGTCEAFKEVVDVKITTRFEKLLRGFIFEGNCEGVVGLFIRDAEFATTFRYFRIQDKKFLAYARSDINGWWPDIGGEIRLFKSEFIRLEVFDYERGEVIKVHFSLCRSFNNFENLENYSGADGEDCRTQALSVVGLSAKTLTIRTDYDLWNSTDLNTIKRNAYIHFKVIGNRVRPISSNAYNVIIEPRTNLYEKRNRESKVISNLGYGNIVGSLEYPMAGMVKVIERNGIIGYVETKALDKAQDIWFKNE